MGRGEPRIPADLIDSVVAVAQNTADELTRSDNREVKLMEDPDLQLPFLLPEDGYSCDIVKGVPNGLPDFIGPLSKAGLCCFTVLQQSNGGWTVFMGSVQENLQPTGGNELTPVPSGRPEMPPQNEGSLNPLDPKVGPNEPEVATVTFNKVNGSLGLSIVAAKGERQRERGIYVKSVVPGGGAAMDGRLQAGDQLMEVDGHNLIGLTQERAAEFMTKTGQTVTLRVAKQGAIYHGLATLLSQPSPVMARAAASPSQRGMPPPTKGQQQRPLSENVDPRFQDPEYPRNAQRPINMQHSAQSSPALAGQPHEQMPPSDPYGSYRGPPPHMAALAGLQPQQQPPMDPRESNLRSKSTSNLDQAQAEYDPRDPRHPRNAQPAHPQQGFNQPPVNHHRMEMDRSASHPELRDNRYQDPRNSENPDYENFAAQQDRYGRPTPAAAQPNYMNHTELRTQGLNRPSQSMGNIQQEPPQQRQEIPRTKSDEIERVREWQQRNEVAEQRDRHFTQDVPRSQANTQQYQQNFYQNTVPRHEEANPPFEQLRADGSPAKPVAAPRGQQQLRDEDPRDPRKQIAPQPKPGRSAQDALRPGAPFQYGAQNHKFTPQSQYYKPQEQQHSPKANSSTKYQVGTDGRPMFDKPIPTPTPRVTQSPQSPELPPPPPPETPPELPPPPAELQEDLPPPPPNDYERQIKEEQDRMARRLAGIAASKPDPRHAAQQERTQPPTSTYMSAAPSSYSGSVPSSYSGSIPASYTGTIPRSQAGYQDYENLGNSASRLASGGSHPLYSQAGGPSPFGAMENEGRYDPLSRAKPAQPQSSNKPAEPRGEQRQAPPPQPQKKPPPPISAKPKPPPVASKPQLAFKEELEARNSSPSPSPWERDQKEREGKRREEEMKGMRDSEIADLESRLNYLTPEEKDRLRKLRVDQEFERRAQEALAEDGDSDTDMGDRAAGRARMLKLLQNDVERRRQQIADDRTIQQKRESLGDMEKIERAGRKISQFEQEREEQRLRQQRRNEKHAQETQEQLRKQRELREQQRLQFEEGQRLQKQEEEKQKEKQREELRRKKEMERDQMREMRTSRDEDLGSMPDASQHQFVLDRMQEREQQMRREFERIERHTVREKSPLAAPKPPERNSSYNIYPSGSMSQMPSEGEPRDPMGNRSQSNSSVLKHPAQDTLSAKKSVSFHSNLATEIHEDKHYFPSVSSEGTTPTSTELPPPPPPATQPDPKYSSYNPTYSSPAYTPAQPNYPAPSFQSSNYNPDGYSQGPPPPSSQPYSHPAPPNSQPQNAPQSNYQSTPSSYPAESNFQRGSYTEARTPPSNAYETSNSNLVTGDTPGVIGAGEVYRDPRDRIAANKPMAQNNNNLAGERLSFRDKMRMFAAEIGEGTPQEKVKISRVQQRIDLNGR
ncbi:hypothetical protein CAPTEDRAFT_228923 [Capitella teleta]|uniref:PDZ domain-containing protein n=1 Tax=Capitella teleta TaxID=283909 RepID=R7TTH0_CAPTE|nr:hypothetical protein CAPTEDRAFT_228923 [Capitella teleta]|eukprot:ELT96969.1 hypothetical protein CAPTEDRAFT_228923 [Capitella teleta]